MHLVVGLNVYGRDAYRRLDPTQTTGKGLLIDMGMVEHPIPKDIVLGIDYPPVVGVVIPTVSPCFRAHSPSTGYLH